MGSIKKFISEVNQTINANSVDLRIPNKYIYNLGVDIVADFLKKESEARRITTASEGWSEIACFPMQEVPMSECAGIDVYLCERMMRTVNKVPPTFTGYNGNIIRHVASLNFGQIYEPLRGLRIWNDVQKREVKKKNLKYYVFINQYIYIPLPKGDTSTPEKIRIEAYFKSKWEIEKINNSTDACESCDPKTPCIDFLDSDFVCPEYLLSPVIQETSRVILTKFKIPEDNKPDLNDYSKGQQQSKQG